MTFLPFLLPPFAQWPQPFLLPNSLSWFWFSCFLWSLLFPLQCWHQSPKSWRGTDAVPVRVLGFWHQKLTLLSRKKKKLLESHQVVNRIDRKPGESGWANKQEPKETSTREDSQGHTTENHSAGTVPSVPRPPATNGHYCHLTLLKKRALTPRARFRFLHIPSPAWKTQCQGWEDRPHALLSKSRSVVLAQVRVRWGGAESRCCWPIEKADLKKHWTLGDTSCDITHLKSSLFLVCRREYLYLQAEWQ